MSKSRFPAAQRHDLILEALKNKGFVAVPTMAKSLHVSEMTLRRDLDQLAEQNCLTRTHGGAASPNRIGELRVALVEPSVEERAVRNHEAKMQIANHAYRMVLSSRFIALDVGTTTFELADLLGDIKLNVFTNSMKIARHLSESQPNTYVPGGQVNGYEPSIIGSRAINHINEFYFDYAILGVSGISEEGFYDYSPEDTEIKRALIARAQSSVVLLDSSKFECMSVVRVAPLEDIDILITDKQPSEILSQALEASGVRVEIAPPLN